MPTNKLTDAKCKAAKPGPKEIKLFDGGGLYLAVTPAGGKIWRLAYRVDGKPTSATLGHYPVVSLAEAREKRDAKKGEIAAGVLTNRQQVVAVPTFEELARSYWSGRKDLSAAYLEKTVRALEMYLFPKLGKSPVNAVTRAELLAALQVMDAKGLHTYVRKTRGWASQVFEHGIELEHCTDNPAAQINPKKAFAHAPVENLAALEISEVPDFMKRLALEKELDSVLACRFLAYTWVRTVEMRFMKWSEFEADLWRVPKERMKRRRDHIVPLPRQAVAILEEMERRSRGSEFVFAAEHRLDRPISENAVLYLLHRMGYKGRMTGHGWRSVGSTWANENGFDKDAIERQLAHSPDDKVRAAYNRAEYLPERRAMLQAWADWLDSCNVDAGSAKG